MIKTTNAMKSIFQNLKHSQTRNRQSGFTLIEVVTYFAVFSAVSVFALMSLFSTMENFSKLQASQEALASGRISMDRLSFEIRRAGSVDVAASEFSGESQKLVLERVDGTGAQKTTTFSADDGKMLLSVDGENLGALTRMGARVTDLDFEFLEATHAKAVKMNIKVRGMSNGASTEKSFQNTVLLQNNASE